jgi:REP-associated tyrosine transposase
MSTDAHHRHRRSMRLAGYDYSQAGAYFVTICTHDRIPLFGEVIDDAVRLSPNGIVVMATRGGLSVHYPNLDLDAFIVMPNHIHGIIVLADVSSARHGLPEIVRGFKTFSARSINELRRTRGTPLWQRGYYEHVIRIEKALNRVRSYIAENPRRWADDPENLWRQGV